jgi:sterol desaturase/sphingolipid hydroxylase (fatty acid hydroxylase superfamily)
MMHKWNTRSLPDVGAWLYKHVHSLHHKSRNPTAWSGVSMHPVESFMYYTAMLVPVAFGAHPLVALYTKVDLTLGAL